KPGRFNIKYQQGFQDLIDQGQTERLVTFTEPVAKEVRAMQDGPEHLLPSVSGNIRLDVGHSGRFYLPGEFYEPCEDPKDSGFRPDGYDMRLREPWALEPTNYGGIPVRVSVPPPEDDSDNNPVIPPQTGTHNDPPPPPATPGPPTPAGA